MRTHYVRHSDGMAVTDEEALEKGVFAPGFRMSVGIHHDPMPYPEDCMHDTADAFTDHLPSSDARRVASILADFNSREVFRVSVRRRLPSPWPTRFRVPPRVRLRHHGG